MNMVQDFTGGLNNKLNKIKILDSQGQIYNNIDVITNCLSALKNDKEVDQEVDNVSPYYFKKNWTFAPNTASYARLLGLAYRAYDSKLEKTYSGKSWVNLWIEPPQEAPKITLGDEYEDGNEDPEGFYGEDIRYCYTYYNSTDGAESAPSPYSPSMVVGRETTGNNAHWIKQRTYIAVKKSNDPQIDQIRIYRMGGGVLTFQCAVETSNITENILDNRPTDDLGDQIDTIGYIEPPKVSYICAYYALLFGVQNANKNILQYSNEANPLIWNPLNYIIFDENIVGLGASSLGLLVFTEYRVYIIYGTTVSEFQRYLLYDNIGCMNHNSIQSYKGMVIWQAKAGIYLFDGSNCTNLTVMVLQEFENEIISSTFLDEVYYGLFDNGNIITIDFRFETHPVMMITDSYEGIHAANNKLYGIKNGKLYEVTGSTECRELHWKSKAYTESAATVLKNYKYLQVYVNGNFRFKCYTDGRLAADIQLKEGYTEVKLNQELRTAYMIEFEIIGKGQVLEIAYSFESRLQSRGV